MITEYLIVEGIDNIGKGTLIEGIIRETGFWNILKYERPRKVIGISDLEYQRSSFEAGFSKISTLGSGLSGKQNRIIFDRFHLGEVVYSSKYRGYDGSYVYDTEDRYLRSEESEIQRKIAMILLRASRFDLIVDDGKSFDHDRGMEEQRCFIEAFERSRIQNKLIVDVHEGDSWKSPDSILGTVISYLESIR